MALPRVSGRSRVVTCTAVRRTQTRNGRVTDPGTGATASDQASALAAWFPMGTVGNPVITGLSLSVTHPVTGTVYSGSGGFASVGLPANFPFNAPISVGFTLTFTGGATLSGSGSITLPSLGSPGANAQINSIQFLLSSADTEQVVTASALLEEWIQTDFTRFERLKTTQNTAVKTFTGLSVHVSFSGIYTNSSGFADLYWQTFNVPAAGSVAVSTSGSAAPNSILTDYSWTHTLSATGGLSISSSIGIGGPGMESLAVALPPSGGLTGTSLAPQLTSSSGLDHTVKGEPGWAWRGLIDFRSYDGLPLRVNTNHLCGNGIATYDTVSSGYGDHRYPTEGGLTAWASYTIPGPTTWENYRKLMRCGTVPGNLNAANYIKIDQAAADQNGILFNTPIGNSIWCSYYQTPPFAAATIDVASSHEFTLFEALGKFSADSRLTFPASGFLTYTNETATARQITATYTLKPYGYRYYQFGLRTKKAGSRCALILTRSTSRASTVQEILDGFGPTRTFTATYRYEFTSQTAGAWETKRFDLLFPDEHTDGASFFERYPVHPELFIAGGGVAGLQVEFLDADTYELDSFTGYHRSDHSRVPLRLTTHLSLNGALPIGTTLEAYETPSTHPDLQYTEQNNIFGRMIVNGARGFWMGRTVGLTSQTVNSTWSTHIFAIFDTVANDTGISIVLDAGLYPTEVAFIGSVLGGESLAEELDGTYTAYHQHRANASWGYYGMGDPLGSGEYAPEITNRGRKWLQGIVQGILYNETRPVRGVKLECRRQPEGSFLNRDVSDHDGYYQMVVKYGVVRTYSNLPVSSDWADRKQFTESGGAIVSYTETGKRFLFHWLYGKRLVEQDSEHYAEDDLLRRKIVVIERYPSWYDWEVFPGPAPANLATDWGFYFEVDTRSEGGIECRRSRLWPEIDLTATVTEDITADHPHLYRDYRERLWCLWQAEGGTFRSYSDDDGATWSEGVMSIEGAWFPHAAVDPQTGIILETAYRDGALVGRLQYPGDAAPRAVFTVTGFDQDPVGTPHDVVWDHSGQRRVIYVLSDGEDSTRYESFDDGATVRRVG